MKKIKAAVIGVGNMGKHHARNYFELRDVNLVGISDLDLALGQEIASKYECKYYSDYKQLLVQERPQLVSVVVPTRYHLQVGLDVIQAGANLLMEKPIAFTSEDGNKLITEANRNKVKISVGHIERFNPAVRELKKMVDRGDLGEITSIVTRRVGTFPPQIRDANVVIDLAVHDIDVINYILNRQPDFIFASGGHALIEDREDHAEIFMKYGKVGCFVQVNWITPIKIRTLSVTGNKGSVEVNYVTQKLTVHKSVINKQPDTFGEFLIKFGETKTEELSASGEEPLKLEVKSFIEAIVNDKAPEVTGEDGVRALAIAEKALLSISTGEVTK